MGRLDNSNAKKSDASFFRWLPLVLMASAVLIFILSAARGIDLTDESFCFLNYLYWKDFVAGLSFFGMYLGVPFQLVGETIIGARIFGLALLIAAGAFFFYRLLHFY